MMVRPLVQFMAMAMPVGGGVQGVVGGEHDHAAGAVEQVARVAAERLVLLEPVRHHAGMALVEPAAKLLVQPGIPQRRVGCCDADSRKSQPHRLLFEVREQGRAVVSPGAVGGKRLHGRAAVPAGSAGGAGGLGCFENCGSGLDPFGGDAILPSDCSFPNRISAGRQAVPPEHKPYLCLATVALAALALLGLAGCQTPPQSAAPAYGAATVAPPGTGMMGQPAPYGGYVSSPQGAAYPPGAPVMPGPSNNMQGAPAAPSLTAPNNSWSWSQSAAPATQPSMQQYGNQINAQANQYQQNLTNQAQQYANQAQAQPQQWANATQQSLANQQQQMTNQLQNTANQYQQGLNNTTQQYTNQINQNLQQQQQQLSGQMQQATNQFNNQVQQSMPQQQTVNGNWWPFQSPNGLPPPRATPALPARY